jgi:hypothetical protein
MNSKNYQIIDNALSLPDLLKIKSVMLMDQQMPWFYSSSVTAKDSDSDCFYFTHTFLSDYKINSNLFDMVSPILEILKPTALIRIKGNLYPNLGRNFRNDNHVDYEFKHRGAIFYVNTNNGKTILEDDIEIDSVENRLLIFDASKPHCSTHCTDEKIRVNINFNYYG